MRRKSGLPRPPLDRLQAVVAGEPAAQAGLDAPEGQVDLVVDHHDAVEVTPSAPRAGPTELPESFM